MQQRKRAEGQEEGIRAGRSLVAIDNLHFSSPSLLSSRAFSG